MAVKLAQLEIQQTSERLRYQCKAKVDDMTGLPCHVDVVESCRVDGRKRFKGVPAAQFPGWLPRVRVMGHCRSAILTTTSTMVAGTFRLLLISVHFLRTFAT